jgi:hypothetical protein
MTHTTIKIRQVGSSAGAILQEAQPMRPERLGVQWRTRDAGTLLLLESMTAGSSTEKAC